MSISIILKKLSNAKGAVVILLFLLFVALLGNFIAADSAKAFVPPIVPYDSQMQDRQNDNFKSPFEAQNVSSLYFKHWFGTDLLGRDTLAGLIAGTRVALLVGVGGTFIALIIGLFLGLSAGYYGNDRFKLSKIELILRGVMLSLCLFYVLVFFQQKMPFFVYVLLFIITYAIIKIFDFLFKNTFRSKKKIQVPLDSIIMRFVEVVQAVPTILWLVGLVAINGKMNIGSLILFMGLVTWTTKARLVRGEVKRIRESEYMESAQALGLSHWRIITRHALPNVLTPVLVAVAFSIANLILMEAGLTFIGFGLPLEQVTWGSMLNIARDNPSAWWLVIFPGFMIFMTVYALNKIGETLRK